MASQLSQMVHQHLHLFFVIHPYEVAVFPGYLDLVALQLVYAALPTVPHIAELATVVFGKIMMVVAVLPGGAEIAFEHMQHVAVAALL